jgi:hypothetical protein
MILETASRSRLAENLPELYRIAWPEQKFSGALEKGSENGVVELSWPYN